MKAILEYDLDNPDERLAHKRAVSATDAYIALLRIREAIPTDDYDEDCKHQFSVDQFHEILDDLSINMNDLP